MRDETVCWIRRRSDKVGLAKPLGEYDVAAEVEAALQISPPELIHLRTPSRRLDPAAGDCESPHRRLSVIELDRDWLSVSYLTFGGSSCSASGGFLVSGARHHLAGNIATGNARSGITVSLQEVVLARGVHTWTIRAFAGLLTQLRVRRLGQCAI